MSFNARILVCLVLLIMAHVFPCGAFEHDGKVMLFSLCGSRISDIDSSDYQSFLKKLEKIEWFRRNRARVWFAALKCDVGSDGIETIYNRPHVRVGKFLRGLKFDCRSRKVSPYMIADLRKELKPRERLTLNDEIFPFEYSGAVCLRELSELIRTTRKYLFEKRLGNRGKQSSGDGSIVFAIRSISEKGGDFSVEIVPAQMCSGGLIERIVLRQEGSLWKVTADRVLHFETYETCSRFSLE